MPKSNAAKLVTELVTETADQPQTDLQLAALTNLCKASADTLRLLEALPAHFAVTEQWRSRPPSDDPALLACHLGEMVAKECARDRLMRVLTLRLGYPEVPGDRTALSGEYGPAAVAASSLASPLAR